MPYLLQPPLIHKPFGGLTNEQLPSIVQPRRFTPEVRALIGRGGRQAIQFVGRQGRGKTTHLRLLAGEVDGASLHLVPRHSTPETVLADEGGLLFVDSIHQLTFRQRQQLFRKEATIVFTTHIPRQPECLLAGMPLRSFRFKGLSPEEMIAIIRARTQDAMEDKGAAFVINEAYNNCNPQPVT
jgi:hypothetical protein